MTHRMNAKQVSNSIATAIKMTHQEGVEFEKLDREAIITCLRLDTRMWIRTIKRQSKLESAFYIGWIDANDI